MHTEHNAQMRRLGLPPPLRTKSPSRNPSPTAIISLGVDLAGAENGSPMGMGSAAGLATGCVPPVLVDGSEDMGDGAGAGKTGLA